MFVALWDLNEKCKGAPSRRSRMYRFFFLSLSSNDLNFDVTNNFPSLCLIRVPLNLRTLNKIFFFAEARAEVPKILIQSTQTDICAHEMSYMNAQNMNVISSNNYEVSTNQITNKH